MRELFVSERRYIRNMLLRYRNIEIAEFGKVLVEEYSPPRVHAQTRFNNDYVLQFVKDLSNFESCCASVLPNTLGAELFLTFDRDTFRPLRTELLAGEAFPVRFFKHYIEIIEERLCRLSQNIQLRKCAYCRILVIENDICFLAFPNEEVPIALGEKGILCSDSESLIECSMKDNRVLCIDGWFRTEVIQSNRKLVAST